MPAWPGRASAALARPHSPSPPPVRAGRWRVGPGAPWAPAGGSRGRRAPGSPSRGRRPRWHRVAGPRGPACRPRTDPSPGPGRAGPRCRPTPRADARRPPCRRVAGACGHPPAAHGPEGRRAAGRPPAGWPPRRAGARATRAYQPATVCARRSLRSPRARSTRPKRRDAGSTGRPGPRLARPAGGRQGGRGRAPVGRLSTCGPGPRGLQATVAPRHGSTDPPRAPVVLRRYDREDGSRPAETPPEDGHGVVTTILPDGLCWSSCPLLRRLSSRLWDHSPRWSPEPCRPLSRHPAPQLTGLLS
jgi:hypothetical protein